jgi:hypothetical protein
MCGFAQLDTMDHAMGGFGKLLSHEDLVMLAK